MYEFIADPLNKLILFTIIAFLLLKTPIVGKYFAILNTLVHEVGHALVTLLTLGKVEKIELFSNSSGTAWSTSRFWIGRVLTNLAGYVGSSATAYMLLYLISKRHYIIAMTILTTIFIFSFIFWIRNLYGLLWITTFAGLTYTLVKYDSNMLNENFLIFITSIIFVESIISAYTICKLSFTQPTNAGDATNLWKSIIFIPSPIWGTFFLMQSLVFSYLGINLFL